MEMTAACLVCHYDVARCFVIITPERLTVLRQMLDLLPVMPVLRGPLRGARWAPASADHGAWLGTYEREVQDELRRAVKPGWTCWDVGANAGLFTLLLARLVGRTGKVIAVEPSPRAITAFKGNVTRNPRLEGRVTLLEVAASDSEGVTALWGDGSAFARLAPDGECLVRTARLDTLALPAPNLVKLDVEGHELGALVGMRFTLERHRPVLFIEFHGTGMPSRDCDTEVRTMLQSFGYSFRLLTCGETIAWPTASVE
jgi:FkbM family methyltransferase